MTLNDFGQYLLIENIVATCKKQPTTTTIYFYLVYIIFRLNFMLNILNIRNSFSVQRCKD